MGSRIVCCFVRVLANCIRRDKRRAVERALGHTMMGVYRSVENGEVAFYEIMSLVETERSIEMRLRHFHADLIRWKKKTVCSSFPWLRLPKARYALTE